MQIDPEPELFNLCLSAHQCVSGSSDAISDEQLQVMLTKLKRRRDNWKPSSDYAKAFDDAVFAVLQASIAEVEAYFAIEEELLLTASRLGLSRSFADEQFVHLTDDPEPSKTVGAIKPSSTEQVTLYTDGACSNNQSTNRIAGRALYC